MDQYIGQSSKFGYYVAPAFGGGFYVSAIPRGAGNPCTDYTRIYTTKRRAKLAVARLIKKDNS